MLAAIFLDLIPSFLGRRTFLESPEADQAHISVGHIRNSRLHCSSEGGSPSDALGTYVSFLLAPLYCYSQMLHLISVEIVFDTFIISDRDAAVLCKKVWIVNCISLTKDKSRQFLFGGPSVTPFVGIIEKKRRKLLILVVVDKSTSLAREPAQMKNSVVLHECSP